MQKNLCTLLNEAKDDSSKMLQAGNQSLLSPDTEIFKKAVFYRQGRCRTGDDAGIHFNYSQNELFPQPRRMYQLY